MPCESLFLPIALSIVSLTQHKNYKWSIYMFMEQITTYITLKV